MSKWKYCKNTESDNLAATTPTVILIREVNLKTQNCSHVQPLQKLMTYMTICFNDTVFRNRHANEAN